MSSPPSAAPAASPSSSSSPRRAEQAEQVERAAHVEVDTEAAAAGDDGDRDSAYEEGTSTASTSLKSSVVRYEWKHGRRYHAYQAGKYQFPNDEKEQERLDMVHHAFYRCLHDRLFLAPIDPDKGLRVLDVGTGTGLWAIHLGDEHPGAAEIVGNDLSPIQPTWCPPNVRFLVDDVELDWAEPRPYDYIHCRYMAGSIKDWPRLIRQMYNNLVPGGWLELQESVNTLYSQDGSLTEDNPMVRMMDGLMEACDRIGRTMNPAPSMERWVRDAGFVNVRVHVFPLPVGAWPRDPRLKEIGTLLAVNFTEGVEAFTAALFADVLGWSKDEIAVLNAGVRSAAKKADTHALFDFLVITAQKPEK
ncbi:S-adenosyl-L-methionine-dependent methyltransferase [Thermothelomyces heterothallicus CBS 202.75]|uniref:S-adenosyl-L-methionine-dependent methyltransferase n=1 Tax=Thermothelomyces heterothallicus CBS 202.75 TaxID=1149848 RepID=UPI003742FF23